MSQITDKILMIRPANFGYNEQTAENNAFQTQNKIMSNDDVKEKAKEEFDRMVAILRDKGIHVDVVQDTESPIKPDCIFPNNWMSLHQNGSVITYPMYAPNRRIERRADIIDFLEDKYHVTKRYEFEHYEEQNMFLEGTGSMIFDRDHKIVYACISERTDIRLLDKFCVLTGYSKVAFTSVDRHGDLIYHTNVMMALGTDFCVLVKESIKDEDELISILSSLERTGKKVIDISFDQMEAYAGNMLQVKSENGKKYLVMSKSAHESLNETQREDLGSFTELLPVDIYVIETIGGGSVRCMMAENFLKLKN